MDRWLAAAAASAVEKDTAFGADKRGDEMPDWVADTAKRLAKIREAKVAAEEETRAEAQAEEERPAEGKKKPGKKTAPPSREPDPKARRKSW